MYLKFMPQMPASTVGGNAATATTVNNFITLFWLTLMKPKIESSRNCSLPVNCSSNSSSALRSLRTIETRELWVCGIQSGWFSQMKATMRVMPSREPRLTASRASRCPTCTSQRRSLRVSSRVSVKTLRDRSATSPPIFCMLWAVRSAMVSMSSESALAAPSSCWVSCHWLAAVSKDPERANRWVTSRRGVSTSESGVARFCSSSASAKLDIWRNSASPRQRLRPARPMPRMSSRRGNSRPAASSQAWVSAASGWQRSSHTASAGIAVPDRHVNGSALPLRWIVSIASPNGSGRPRIPASTVAAAATIAARCCRGRWQGGGRAVHPWIMEAASSIDDLGRTCGKSGKADAFPGTSCRSSPNPWSHSDASLGRPVVPRLSERQAQQHHGLSMVGFVKVIVGNVPDHHLPVTPLPSERTDEFIGRAERIRLAIGQRALESEKCVAPQVQPYTHCAYPHVIVQSDARQVGTGIEMPEPHGGCPVELPYRPWIADQLREEHASPIPMGSLAAAA